MAGTRLSGDTPGRPTHSTVPLPRPRLTCAPLRNRSPLLGPLFCATFKLLDLRKNSTSRPSKRRNMKPFNQRRLRINGSVDVSSRVPAHQLTRTQTAGNASLLTVLRESHLNEKPCTLYKLEMDILGTMFMYRS